MRHERADRTVPDPLLRRAARDGADTDLSSACVAAETAAAWADGALKASEVSALMAHAAACARCRALLGALVQSEPPRPASAPWWKAPVVLWGAPLAAVAGGLLIWVGVQQPRLVRLADTPPSASAPAVPGESTRAARPSDDQARPWAPSTLADSTATPSGGLPPRREAATPQARADSLARSGAPAAGAPPPPTAVDSIASAREQRQAKAGAPAPEALMAPESVPLAQVMAVAEIVSPDVTSRWRLGRPGIVERSIDGGKTWSPQPVDAEVILTAGSSPAPATCWIVGAAGTVLRTIDGSTWQRLASPDPADLVAVTATDGANATVATADGRTFITSDGGVTWTRRPLQEDPAASF